MIEYLSEISNKKNQEPLLLPENCCVILPKEIVGKDNFQFKKRKLNNGKPKNL
jgi:hypothetical protein